MERKILLNKDFTRWVFLNFITTTYTYILGEFYYNKLVLFSFQSTSDKTNDLLFFWLSYFIIQTWFKCIQYSYIKKKIILMLKKN